jgi:transcriptional regulator with XRE-family HTH domain
MDPLTLGTRIKRARERAHMTQAQLAERLNVARKTVANWENGRGVPRSRLGALEHVLDDDTLSMDAEQEAPAVALTSADASEDGDDAYTRLVERILRTKLTRAEKQDLIAAITDLARDAGEHRGHNEGRSAG